MNRNFRQYKLMPLLCTSIFITCVSYVQASASVSEDYSAGEELYDLACANCHGKNLVNPGSASFNLKTFPKNDKQRFVESVTNGKGFMPAMGAAVEAEEIEQLWIYISEHK